MASVTARHLQILASTRWSNPCSLSPLTELTGLRSLTIEASDHYWDVDAVAAIPALTELRFWDIARAEQDETWRGVIDALRARGVSVHAV